MALDDPRQHPLYEEQVNLERGMTLEGARRFQDAVASTNTKGQQSRLQPYQDLMQAWLPKIGVAFQDWLTTHRRSRVPVKPLAFPLLDNADLMVASLIALRVILDGLASARGRAVTSIALSIGSTIEHELMVRAWEKNAPGLYHDRKNRLKLQGADPAHTRRVNIHEFNRLMDEGKFGFEWRNWTGDERIAVGAVLINCVMIGTGWFEAHVDQEMVKTTEKTATYLYFKPGMEEWVTTRLSKMEELSPALKPTIMPPKPWSGTQDGGYWTPYVHGPHLIRFKAVNVDHRMNAQMDYDALEMPRVYQSLHFLQNTPWRINKKVHAVIQEAMARHKTFAGLPDYQGRDVPPPPVVLDLLTKAEKAEWRNTLEGRAWRTEASQAKAYNSRLATERRRTTRVLQVAHEYQGYERFYFPYMLDWRGRMYPIPLFLQPQGDDVARGLLEFAEGKRVTKQNGGARWLCINIASAWGNDKVSFDERVAWVWKNHDLWHRIAWDPIGTAEEWVGCDKPWQALAAILDWVGYLNAVAEGEPYQSHAVVAVDGTCNGLQHLSAMSGDAMIGKHVNLVPGDKPQDVYQHVADNLLPVLQTLRKARNKEGDNARYWLSKVDPKSGKLPRLLVKNSVMILAYSATMSSFFENTREWLDENDPLPPRPEEGYTPEYRKLVGQRNDRVFFLSKKLWDAVQDQLPRQMRVMEWLQECAKLASTGNQPIYWTTPDGFVVRHFYGKVRPYKIRVKLDGSVFDLRLYEHTKDLDRMRQKLGIAPNYVHSLDAAAARGCINRAENEGYITAFCAIHDSFGTHAADMERLYGYLREAFVEVHKVGVLIGFRNACLGVMVAEMIPRLGIDPFEASQMADEKLPQVPDIGDLDLEGVLRSDYFFA